MLTKRLRRKSAAAEAAQFARRATHPRPKSFRARSRSGLARAASGVALCAALVCQTLHLGVAPAALAQTGAGGETPVRIQGVPAHASAAAAVNFSALALGGQTPAARGVSGGPSFVEPPAAPPEPEARAVRPSGRGRILTKTARPPAAKSADDSHAQPADGPHTKSSADSRSSAGEASPASVSVYQAQSDPGFVAPPDVGGAVGLNRVMSTHRSNYVVQDKATGAVVSSVPADTFWAQTGAFGTYNPRALYDPYNHRWLLSAVSNSRSAASSLLVAVSQTSDPSGSYHIYRYDADGADALWADFASLGFNQKWVVVSFNAHNVSDNVFNQGRVLALDYAALRAGVWSASLFGGISRNSGGFSMQPAVTYSKTEGTLYLVSHLSSGGATYRLSYIEGEIFNPVLTVGITKANPLGGWTQPDGEILPQAPDPNGLGNRKIESSDSRVQKVVYRNGSIYYCQTVGLPGGGGSPATIERTAAQWVQLDAYGDFVQGGRVEDPSATPTNGGKWYAYPSLTVNQFDDVFLGFTQFASDQHPAAGYAVHVSGDAPGSLRGPVVYKAGEGYYEKTLTGARNLWGLYSTAQVDPSNDRDLWTIQEYAAAPVGVGNNSGRWGTWWARLRMPNRPPSVAITKLTPAPGGIYVDPATIWMTATASDLDGFVTSVEFFEGQTKIGDGVQSSPGTFIFGWTKVRAGTYSLTARATDNEGGTTTSDPVTVVVHPVTVLSDDFNDNSTDASKWSVVLGPGMSVVEQNQRLEITTPTSGVGYGGYHARSTFDLTDRRATVEVPKAFFGHGADTYFVLHDKNTENSSFLFAVGGVPGSLLMRETFNGSISSQTTIPYDAAQHRFWRIRHDPAADTVRWETSPDGLQWTQRHAAARRIGLNNLQTQLYAGRFTTTTPSGLAVFDNYRVEDNPPSRVLLADDFNDNARDPAKWNQDDPNNTVASAREQNQRLEIAPSPSQIGYNGYTSVNTYDFTNASAAVEVLQATAGSSETYLLVRLDNGDYVTTVVSGGNIIFQYSVGGARSRTFIPYNPAAHRFWRIRHDIGGDSIVWETSPDGVNWTVQRTAARPIPITSVRFILTAGKWTNTNSASPGTAVYDNFRAERLPLVPPTDNFNDNSLDPARWSVYAPGSPMTVSEQNQRLEVALAPSTAGYNGVVSAPAFSFWNKTVTVEVPQTTSQAGWVETFIMLWLDDNNFYQIVTGAGNVTADVVVNGAETRTVVPYNAAAHRFWRMRHNAAAHTMNFEVSGDGQTWTTLRTSPVTFSLEGMRFYLAAGAWGTGNAAPGTAVFDNVRVENNE